MLIVRVLLLLFFLLPINSWANGESQTSLLINIYQNPPKGTNEQSNEDKYSCESIKTKLKEIMSQYQNDNITKEGSQQSYRWYNIITLIFSFLLVIATSLLVVYNCRLWNETAGLLKASQDQSGHMKTSLDIAQEAANAARKSADAAEKSLALIDRPWIKVNLAIAGPLQFIKFGERTLIRTSVHMKIMNIGRSVATNIRSDCKISFARVFNSNYHFDEITEQKNIFNELLTHAAHPIEEGECIFPDDERVFTKNLDYTIEENDFFNIKGFEEIEGRKFLPDCLYPLLVISCVDYQFDASPRHHQSGIIDRIIQTTQFPEGTPGHIINGHRAIKFGDEIPVNELEIIPYAAGGRKAN